MNINKGILELISHVQERVMQPLHVLHSPVTDAHCDTVYLATIKV